MIDHKASPWAVEVALRLHIEEGQVRLGRPSAEDFPSCSDLGVRTLTSDGVLRDADAICRDYVTAWALALGLVS